MVLLSLALDIIENIPSPTRAVDPIKKTPRSIVGRPAARVVNGGALYDAAHEDAWYGAVTRHGERLFDSREGEEEEVGEEMGAKESGGEVDRDEAVDDEREGVVGEKLEAKWGAGSGVGVLHVKT